MYIPSSNLTNVILGQHVEGMGDLRVEALREKAGTSVRQILLHHKIRGKKGPEQSY